MFRWYAADMTQMEYMRLTPRSLFIYAGITMLSFWLITKLAVIGMVCVFFFLIEINNLRFSILIFWYYSIEGHKIFVKAFKLMHSDFTLLKLVPTCFHYVTIFWGPLTKLPKNINSCKH